MQYLSFPGLGLDRWFHLDKEAFTIFGKSIAWYAIFITCGMILAFVICLLKCRKYKIVSDNVIDITLYTIIFGVLGARAYYVIFSLSNYLVKDGTGFFDNFWQSFKKMIAIWEGGLAIPGGLIAGGLTILIVCKIKKINFWTFIDTVIPGVLLAQSIGRWGNFFNVEAYGTETDWFTRMGIARVLNGEIVSQTFVHPTFLYESVWNLIGFALILILFNKKKYHGQWFITYLSWYSFGRFFVETLRTDALMAGDIKVTRLLSVIVFAISMILHILFLVLKAKDKLPEALNIEAIAAEDVAEDAEETTDDTTEEAVAEDAEETTDNTTDEAADEVADEAETECEEEKSTEVNQDGSAD